jgi:hypothetical protein
MTVWLSPGFLLGISGLEHRWLCRSPARNIPTRVLTESTCRASRFYWTYPKKDAPEYLITNPPLQKNEKKYFLIDA